MNKVFIRSQFLVTALILVNLTFVITKSAQEWPSKASERLKPEHQCRHRHPTFDEVPHPVKIEDLSGSRTKRQAEGSLRIKVFYHKSVDDLVPSEKRLVKKVVVPSAVEEWQSALNVKRARGPIKLNRKCMNNQYFLVDEDPGEQYCKEVCVTTKCGEFTLPDNHLKSCKTCDADGRRCRENAPNRKARGIENADFVLYVSAMPTSQCSETIGGEAETVAYAAHCQQEAELDRPIAGHTNICPQALNSTKIESLISTIRHELLHALGFSASLYAFYRDENGDPRTPRGDSGKPPIDFDLRVRKWSENTIKTVTRPWIVRDGVMDRTFHLMVTPRVVQEVRDHFDCQELEGAELEDQGGDGTALTHWEKRIFQDEAMTGTVHTKNPSYSRLTFALLEDTGWYKPNYEFAHEITWGRGMGCDFAKKSCKELMEDKVMQYPFCNDIMSSSSTKTTCTFDATAVGSCNLVQYAADLPPIYQNFDQVPGVEPKDIAQVGGSVTLADFCPYVQEFTWKSEDKTSRGTRCTDYSNQPSDDNNYALEEYGEGSMCFDQAGPWQQKSCAMLKQWQRYGAGCYSSICEDGMLKIIIENATFTCHEAGQVIDVALVKAEEWLHEGSIICPSCTLFCDDCSSSDSSSTKELQNEEGSGGIFDSGSGEDQDPNEELKQTLEDVVCKAQPRTNTLLGFLQNLGFDPDAFS